MISGERLAELVGSGLLGKSGPTTPIPWWDTTVDMALAMLPTSALAHSASDSYSSSFEPWLIAVLAASAIGYGLGVAKLWRGSYAKARINAGPPIPLPASRLHPS